MNDAGEIVGVQASGPSPQPRLVDWVSTARILNYLIHECHIIARMRRR